MAKIDIKGLEGLKGLGELSGDMQTAWISDKRKNGSLHPKSSFKEADRLYRNLQFVDKYGLDTFKQLDYKERDALYRKNLVDEVFNDKFGKEDNFIEFSNLSTEGKIDALERYKNTEDLNKLYQDTVNKSRDISVHDSNKSLWENFVNQQIYRETKDLSVGNLGTEQAAKNALEVSKSANNEVLEDIIAKDNMRVTDNAKELSSKLFNSWNADILNNKSTYEDFDKAFEDIAQSSPYYNAFKDNDELKNLRNSDKMRMLSEFSIIAQEYGPDKAISALNTKIQDIVADNQTELKKLGVTGVNIAFGTVANLMKDVLAVEAVIASKKGSDIHNNFINGLDEKGNPLPNWKNPIYWDGVENYGTWDINEINKIRENDGVSPHMRVAEPGQELNPVRMESIYSALEMSKFLISEAAKTYATAGLGKGVSALLGAKYSGNILKGASILAANSSKAGIAADKVAATANLLRSGVGMAYSEAYDTASQLDTELKSKEYNRLYKEGAENFESILNSDNAKKDISNLVEESIQYILKENPEIKRSQLDINKITENCVEQYKNSYINNYIDQNENNPEFLKAKNDAVKSTYFANFATQYVAETAQNLTIKNFLFDKGTRETLAFRNYKTPKRGEDGLFRVGTPKKLPGISEKATRNLRIGAQEVGGNFVSEFLDGTRHNIARGWGLTDYNNYIEGLNNPENTGKAANQSSLFLDRLNNAMVGAATSLFDEQNYYEAFIGAISPFMSFNIQGALSKDTYKNLKGGSVKNVLKSGKDLYYNLMMAPISQSIKDEESDYEAAQMRAKALNEVLKENGTLIDQTNKLLITDNNKETAVNKGSTLEVKDTKEEQAYQIFRTLSKNSQINLLEDEENVATLYEQLERISKGEVSDKLISDFLNDSRNKSIAEQSNSKELAKNAIMKNASKFVKIKDSIAEAEEFLNSSRKGKKAKGIVREQLIHSRVMSNLWNERYDEIKGVIGGTSIDNETVNPLARFGSKKGFDSAIQAQNDFIKELNARIDSISKYIETTKKDLNKTADDVHRKIIESQIVTYQNALENTKEELSRANMDLEWMNTQSEAFNNERGSKVLTADEIINNLSAQDRAIMLNPDFKSNYSKSQQKEITKAKDKLQKINPDALEMVQDANVLAARVKGNKESNRLILKDPEAASHIADGTEESLLEGLVRYRKETKAAEIDDQLNKVSDENLSTEIKNLNLTSEYLDRYVQKRPDRKPIIDEVRKLVTLKEDARDAISFKITSDSVKNSFVKIFDDIINSSNTEEEAMTKLEEEISNQVGDAKVDMESIMQELESYSHQRNATAKAKRQELEARKKLEEEKKKIEENLKDGKNFDWGGYKIGDIIYDTNGRKGRVSSFYKKKDGSNVLVAEYTSKKTGKTEKVHYDSKNHKDSISKVKPEKKPATIDMSKAEEVNLGEENPINENPETKGNESKETPTEVTLLNADKKVAYKTVAIDDEGKESEKTYVYQSRTPMKVGDTFEMSNMKGKRKVIEVLDSPITNATNAVVSTINDSPIKGIEAVEESPITNESLQGPEFISNDNVISTPDSADTTANEAENEAMGDTKEDTETPHEPVEVIIGNKVHQYETKPLVKYGIVKETKVINTDSSFNKFNNFLKANNIQLQKIIDRELGKILAKYPDIHIKFLQFGDNRETIGLVIDVTENQEVKKMHDTSLGEFLNIDGKEYLLVGSMGWHAQASNEFVKNIFNSITYYLKKLRNKDNKVKEPLYVDSTAYTTISKTSPGRIPNFWLNEEIQYNEDNRPILKLRTLKELLFDSERNPNKLNYDNLKFAILKGDSFKLLDDIADESYAPPRDISSNNGTLFLMVQAANNKYIPIKIQPVFLNELNKDSDLVRDIESAVESLGSTNKAQRDDALQYLKSILFLGKDNNIYINEDDKVPNIVFIRNGEKYRKRNITPEIDTQELKDIVFNKLNIRVNFTEAALSNSRMLKMFDDAGAFKTTAAYLGTVGMSYFINRIDNNGKPIEENIEIPISPKEEKPRLNIFETLNYNGSSFKLINGVYQDLSGNKITDEDTINKLNIIKEIQDRKIPVSKTRGYVKYYILDNSAENTKVVGLTNNNSVLILSKEKSQNFINDLENKKIEADKQVETKKELKKQAEIKEEQKQKEELDGSEGKAVQTSVEEVILEEKEELPEVKKETVKPVTETKAKQTIEANEDPNTLSNNPEKSFGISEKSTTFVKELRENDSFLDSFMEIAESKGWNIPETFSETKELLDSKGVNTENIVDTEMWLKHLKECVN